MTFTQFNYFEIIAQKGSFSNAAAYLFVSQPAVSKQISLMEEELGFRLFERRERGAVLTEAGRLLLECIRRCGADYRSTLAEIRRSAAVRSSSFRLGFPDLWTPQLYSSGLRAFFSGRTDLPPFEIKEYRLNDLTGALERGEVDAVIAHTDIFTGLSGFRTTDILTLEGGVLYADSCFPDRSAPPTAEELGAMPVRVPTGAIRPFTQLAGRICRRFGLMPPLEDEADSRAVLKEVLLGRSLVLVSEWNFLRDGGFRYVPLGRIFPVCAAFDPGRIEKQRIPIVAELAEHLRTMRLPATDAAASSR